MRKAVEKIHVDTSRRKEREGTRELEKCTREWRTREGGEIETEIDRQHTENEKEDTQTSFEKKA